MSERKIQAVGNKTTLKEYDQSYEDMKYWLSKTPQQRVAAVTFLVHQRLSEGEKMDRSRFSQVKMK